MIKVSIIVPTLNRYDLLKLFLNSLLKQTVPLDEFEVLIIDNGSTDNTKDLVKEFRGLLNLRYLYEPRNGLHYGRHLGFVESKAEIITYADDDIIAFPTWIESIITSFNKDKNIMLVGGNNYPKFESQPPKWILDLWNTVSNGEKKITWLSVIDMGNIAKYISSKNIYGCNYSVRKVLLKETGGFHPDGFSKKNILFRGDGENHVTDFVLNNNYKIFFNPGASVYHFVPTKRMSIDYVKNRYFNEGISCSFLTIRKTNGCSFINVLSRIKLKSILYFILFYWSFISPLPDKLMFKTVSHVSSLRGFMTHYFQVCKDNELLNWVLKPNFLDS